ncbi:MAG TPA: acyltransferase family protein [Acidimicrobiales bacterium]|nr:acyltransferase family protein [Acidimicrobiales bacterium]
MLRDRLATPGGAAGPSAEAARRDARRLLLGDGPADQRWRVQLLCLAVIGLAVRIGYLLAFKHPAYVGGDAYFYHHGANLLVDGKGFIDPYRYRNGVVAQSADHPPGTFLVLAAASLFGMRSFFWHQLEMSVLGTATVVLVALVAKQLAGRTAGLIAGVVAAVYPNLWFNDSMVMSETVVQFTTALAVLAAYRWWRAPTRARAAWLGAAVAACALSRAEAVLFLPLLVLPLVVWDRRHDLAERLRQLVLSGVVCVLVIAPWVGFNLSRFNEPVYISSGLDPTVAVSNCDTVYYGPITGYWSRPCILAMPVPTTGDVPAQEAAYRRIAVDYIKHHKSRLPAVVVARVARTFGLFHPVQQIKLDEIETRELLFSSIGLGMYYVLLVGTAIGLWAMRRRKIPVSPIIAVVATVAFAVAITFGQTRYRASAEPVLVVAAVVGFVEVARLARDRRVVDLVHAEPPGAAGADAVDVPARGAPVVAAANGGGGGAGHVSAPAAAVAAELADAAPALAGELPPKHREFPCFDGLRAIAALSVIIVHTSFPTGFTTRQHFWGAYTARGEIGVAVFFLISGFLLYRPFVAAHLEGRPGPAIPPYLKRRILRIVPAYWVALFIAAYVLHTVSPPIHSLRSIVIYFGFLQIYFSNYVLHGISAAWTLCVEMSFYLFLPLYGAVLAAFTRRGRDRVRTEIIGLAVLVAISEVWKIVLFAHKSGQQTGAGTWLPAQLDLFAAGMLFALLSARWSAPAAAAPGDGALAREPAVLGRAWVPAASWAMALVCYWAVSTRIHLPRVPVYEATLGQALGRQLLYGAFAFFLLIPAVFGPQDHGLIRRVLRSRPAVALGVISYGIYLWHETWMLKVLAWLHRPLFRTSFLKLTAAVAFLAIVSAAVSYIVVEQPFQRLGRRRRPAARPSAAEAPVPAVAAGRDVPSL